MGCTLRIKSRFVDDDGEREMDEVVPPNDEGTKMVEDVWIKSFRDMLMDALRCGDDIEISIKRMSNRKDAYTI